MTVVSTHHVPFFMGEANFYRSWCAWHLGEAHFYKNRWNKKSFVASAHSRSAIFRRAPVKTLKFEIYCYMFRSQSWKCTSTF